MKKVAIIDYGMGNLDSVARAVEVCGGSSVVTCDPADIREANYIILPGVGSFPEAMRNLRDKGIDLIIKEEVVGKRIPFLGICLGMQLLATMGYEGEPCKGLGLISGEVKKFVPDSADIKIPHVGWNEVIFDKPSALFNNIPSGKDFYFVHSYHLVCKDREDVLTRTPYCGDFVSSVFRDNVIGVQFHPEKSMQVGLKLLGNFLSM
jgi:imidazole glycerol-phosphate synthase subunit HisH